MNTERLQKILSSAGLGSRREMEDLIKSGLVKVNGNVAKIGDVASAKDKIVVKGKLIDNPLKLTQKTRILLYNKPIGEISSRSDPKHEKTVFDNLPKLKRQRWVQVGRLDINTSGLLIFTNNGELANQLMHPKNCFEREYAVRVHGRVNDEGIQNLLTGVNLEDGLAKFKKIEYRGGQGANSWYHVVLTEGKNREVRRLWQSQGVEVSRLIRLRFGPFNLPRMISRGQYFEIPTKQISTLLKDLEVNIKDGKS